MKIAVATLKSVAPYLQSRYHDMTPLQLRRAIRKLYGAERGQTLLAHDIGRDPSTVRRWLAGTTPIPGPVVGLILAKLREQKA